MTSGGQIAANGLGPASHFVYQRAHTLGGRALRLGEHLDIAARALRHIYGFEPLFDEAKIAEKISSELHAGHYPTHTSATVMLYFVPKDGGECEVFAQPERTLLERGYALSSLRPVAKTYEYCLPFGGFPTGFGLSAAALFDTLAISHGATKSVRREGERLLSCGGAPIFGIRSKTLFTAPLLEGAVDSVERNLVIAAAAKSKLRVFEEPVLHSELKEFDELFFADAAGVTSLAECDGAKFMSLVANRLVGNFAL